VRLSSLEKLVTVEYIAERDRGLDEFMPNRKDVRNPRTEYLLKEFQYIVLCNILFQNGEVKSFISELNELQRDILKILEVPQECSIHTSIFLTPRDRTQHLQPPLTASTDLLKIEDLLKIKLQHFKERNVSYYILLPWV